MSTIRIIENEAPPMKSCQFVCDVELHPKLNRYELTKFLNSHTINLLLGRPKSGKTALIYSLMRSEALLKKCFSTIYVFQPTNSQASMKDNIFSKLPKDQLFNELTYENLSEVVQRIKNSDKDENNCIIMDDMGAYLKDNSTLQLLKEIFYNKRHLHVSAFFLVQTWKSLHPDLRKTFDNFFVFRVSKSELADIFEESIEVKKDMVQQISKLVFDKPYEYLFINLPSQRMFKKFNEIIVEE